MGAEILILKAVVGFLLSFGFKKTMERLKNHLSVNKFSPLINMSHNNHKLKNYYRQYWIPIYEGIEISVRTSSQYSDGPSTIVIRNTSDTTIQKAKIFVEAEGCFEGLIRNEFYTRQDQIVFKDVTSDPKEKTLINVPQLDFWTHGDKHIFSYKELYVRLESVVEDGSLVLIGNRVKVSNFEKSDYFNDLAKGNWLYKNEKYYNVAFINRAKLNLASRIESMFNPLPRIFTIPIKNYLAANLFTRSYWKIIDLARETLRYLLIREKIISLWFWTLVILERGSEDENGDLIFEKPFLF
jgi:hypothetical protein